LNGEICIFLWNAATRINRILQLECFSVKHITKDVISYKGFQSALVVAGRYVSAIIFYKVGVITDF
jgi:hypothetical protein